MATLMPNRMKTTSEIWSSGEVKQAESWSSAVVKLSWRALVLPISQQKDGKVRRMVVVAAAAYFLGFSTVYSLDRVRLLYLMHRPFCWSAISIGWYQFGRQAIFNTAIITLVPLLHRCLPGVSLAVLGAIANITEYTLYAFARMDVHLYIALAVSFGHGLPLNMVRGETSRLFGPEEQGPWFACLAILENISFSVGIFLMSIYTISLRFYVGLIFHVYAAMALIMIIFLCIFQDIWLSYTKSVLHNEMSVKVPTAVIQTRAQQSELWTPHKGQSQAKVDGISESEDQSFIKKAKLSTLT
ncbi:solute carrier family 46 member 3-like [Elysia marginata]|uniref:Solute carrier family 46 member 3-like n=1 Tax=Elysia marginata TaxID=1093978 RepID=A0AAV4G3C1_9GAST|nr:solute carrier family 46 member 3-like [Elysia marginata]